MKFLRNTIGKEACLRYLFTYFNQLKFMHLCFIHIFRYSYYHGEAAVKPRFNEVAGDRPNLFVKSRVRYIENLDITNLSGNDQNVRYIEVIVND